MADRASKPPLVEVLRQRGIVVPADTAVELERAAERLERMIELVRRACPATPAAE